MRNSGAFLLVVCLAMAIVLSSCSLAPNLSFADRIIVERYQSGVVTQAVEIQDKAAIDSIIDACMNSASPGSGNCGYDVLRLKFSNGRKQISLWPAGDGHPYLKLDGERGRIYRISPEARQQLSMALEQYGIILEYLK